MMLYTHSPEVAAALDAGRAVVALESTIITHGMPWPRNLEVARMVEQAVRCRRPSRCWRGSCISG